MKYAGGELLAAYYTALNGNVSYGGSAVPVYSVVPPDATLPYIHLNTLDTIEGGTKDAFINDVELLIDIYTESRSYAPVQSISNSVLQLVKANRGSVLTLTNFTIIAQEIAGARETEYIDDKKGFHIIQNTIRINHIIEQK